MSFGLTEGQRQTLRRSHEPAVLREAARILRRRSKRPRSFLLAVLTRTLESIACDIETGTLRRPSLAERHQQHYQTCNCLGDKAVCCDPTCPCHAAVIDGSKCTSR